MHHLITDIQANEILWPLVWFVTVPVLSTETHVHDLHGWTGHIKLQYMIFSHYPDYCLGGVPCVSFVSLSALLYELLH